jgi:DNA-binding transcriptional LysR family regulator
LHFIILKKEADTISLDISLDLYKIFCVVVKTGNMSVAAKELFISQPAVSMAIRQLEDKYGKPLLVRSSKGIRPTAEGKMLFDYLIQALSLIQTAENRYFQMKDLNNGEIKIGASDTILSNYLLPYINEFIKKYPKITIKMTNNLTKETIRLLKIGEVDIGFVNLPISDSEQFDLTECMLLHDALLVGEKYKRLAETGVSIRNVNEYPLLLLEKGSSTRKFLDSYAETNGVILSPAIEFGSTDLLIKFTKIDCGMTFAAREFLLGDLERGEIYEVPITPEIPHRSIGMIRLSGIPISFATERFIKMIAESEQIAKNN